ncbi:uncharacterized protein LAESUDRAFT_723926 [Laetiporus sulphureus 93-53]|uniref:Uncharacterized protein n=1 Tax=Laetiporus sulphureus 93-53 TaxID=1314785 RepID=A0A165F543_9APHY|nr:uncharacterized protein LAESUDRAFT_723926 [Laetiporus sulphureus 93-53]KZT08410.1 hypothetical protein LAESUDRAFT_723926 [Laetiporus sulphureus 93-53]
MFAASRTTACRVRVAPSGTVPFGPRCVASRPISLRYQSTNTGRPSSAMGTSVAAGVAGGGVVLLGVYAWYHFSGIKTAVDATKAARAYYQQTKRTIAEKAPKNPNEIIQFLRQTTKSYTGIIPGASSYVDSTFDALDELHETHGPEVNRILQQGYDEIKSILREKNAGMNPETSMKVMSVLSQRIGELEELGKKAGQDTFKALSDRYPEVGEKLGGGYEELRRMAEQSGPGAKKIMDDTTRQVMEMFSKGFNPDRLNEARELLQSKTDEIRKLAKSSGQDAWNKAVQEASPFLDKLPEIRKLLENNANEFAAAGVAQGNAAQEVFARVKEAAEGDVLKSKEKMKELQEFVLKKAQEAQELWSMDRGWNGMQDWLTAISGGEEILQKTPDIGAFTQLAHQRGEDARKLTKETYDDIVKVLEEKGRKAKQLAERTRQETKQKPS